MKNITYTQSENHPQATSNGIILQKQQLFMTPPLPPLGIPSSPYHLILHSRQKSPSGYV